MAGHPIPDEAVEAALDAMLPDQNWRSHGEEADNWRNDMRLALTAAEQVRIGEEMERNFYTDIEEARTLEEALAAIAGLAA